MPLNYTPLYIFSTLLDKKFAQFLVGSLLAGDMNLNCSIGLALSEEKSAIAFPSKCLFYKSSRGVVWEEKLPWFGSPLVSNIHIYHTYPSRPTCRQMTGGFRLWPARSLDLAGKKSSTCHHTVPRIVAPLSIAELYMMPSGPLPACCWNVNLDPEFWLKPSQNQQSMAYCVLKCVHSSGVTSCTRYTSCVHCLETSTQGWGLYFKLPSTKQ